MKSLSILFLFLFVVFSYTSCAPHSNAESITESDNYDSSEISDQFTLDTSFIVSDKANNLISVQVPITKNEKTNQLIYAYVIEKIYDLCGEIVETEFQTENIITDKTSNTDNYIVVNYTIAYHTETNLSIIFKGWFDKKLVAHPTNLLFTLNIDIEKNERVYLKNKYLINSKLYDTFVYFSQQQLKANANNEWLDNLERFSQDICTEDSFLKGLDAENEFYTYFTNDCIGICYPVPFSLGNYMVTEIPYSCVDTLSISYSKNLDS